VTKNIRCVLRFAVPIAVHLQNANAKFNKIVVYSDITRVSWKTFKLLHRFLFKTMCTKFYQNRLGFVEDMTKTFWCVFSVHSVEIHGIFRLDYSSFENI